MKEESLGECGGGGKEGVDKEVTPPPDPLTHSLTLYSQLTLVPKTRQTAKISSCESSICSYSELCWLMNSAVARHYVRV